MSFRRFAERSNQSAINKFQIRDIGILRQWAPAPTFVAAGSAGSGSSGFSLSAESTTRIGDLLILVVETSGEGTNMSISGWTHFADSPLADVASTSGSKLNVMWRVATAVGTSNFVSIPDSGDHQGGSILAFRGFSALVSNFAVSMTANTTASTTVTWPSIDTKTPNCRLLYIASRPNDLLSNAQFSGFTNANLAGAAEISEYGSDAGNGGGWVACSGTKADAGATGESTATNLVATTNVLFVLAIEPNNALPA